MFTISEAAQRLGVKSRTIRQAIQSGALAPVRFNSRVLRLTQSDLDAWVARCRQPTAA